MLNTYIVDETKQLALIEAIAPSGEKQFITISLSKLEMVLKCTGTWTLYGKGKLYARGYIKDEDGKSFRIEMHRYLTHCPKGLIVDHLDGNGLNNCDDNLRCCTYTANNQNASGRKDNSTGFTGVSRTKNGMYKATISIEGKNKHIGIFSTAIEASNAYQLAKQQYHLFADRNAMIFI